MNTQNNKTNNGWTEERRKKQSMLIQQWQPWQYSTGPKTTKGKKISSRNADKGGYWKKERQMQKELNALLKEQNELLNKI